MTFNGDDLHTEINELRDFVKVYIDQSKEKQRKLKERTNKLTATFKQAIEELSAVSSDYRDLIDDQNEILESIHERLSNYKAENVDKSESVASTSEPTQVEGSESPCFISTCTVSPPGSQPQDERIQMQKADMCSPLHVQRVVYSGRRKAKNMMTLGRSSDSSSSPYLSERRSVTDVEIDEDPTSPLVSKEDVQVQIIDSYHDGDNRKQFACPYQLARGPNNEVIISDRDHHQLVVFDEKLQTSCVYGKLGFGKGTFFFPTGLAVDVTGSCLFVADHNNIIQKFKITYPEGVESPCLFEYVESYGGKGREVGKLHCPCGLAFSKKESKLFVCDQRNHRIQVFANEDISPYAFGERGDGDRDFNEPHSITINSNEDKLFISDHCNHRIQVFTTQGKHITWIVDTTTAPNWPQLQYPRGIHCTHDCRLLVSSTHTNCVLEFGEDGTYKSTLESIHQPGGMILHSTGDVIVTCTDIKKILVLRSIT